MKILLKFIGGRFLFLKLLFLRFDLNIYLLLFLLFFLLRLNLHLQFLPFFSYFSFFSFSLLAFILAQQLLKLLLFLHLSCLLPSLQSQFFFQVIDLILSFLQYLKHQYLIYFRSLLFQEFFAFSQLVLMTFFIYFF